MKLTNHVTSLDLSKQLKKAGLPQKSLFYWFGEEPFIEYEELWLKKNLYDKRPSKICSAYTSSELGEVLPRYNYYYCYSFRGNSISNKYSCVYVFAQDNTIKHQTWGKSEANARAKMILYLAKEGLLEL